MKGSYRRIFAGGAAGLGAFLIAFELQRAPTPAEANWFWMAVGGLMVVLGLIELLSSGPKRTDRSE
jgi:hypothetical protein